MPRKAAHTCIIEPTRHDPRRNDTTRLLSLWHRASTIRAAGFASLGRPCRRTIRDGPWWIDRKQLVLTIVTERTLGITEERSRRNAVRCKATRIRPAQRFLAFEHGGQNARRQYRQLLPTRTSTAASFFIVDQVALPHAAQSKRNRVGEFRHGKLGFDEIMILGLEHVHGRHGVTNVDRVRRLTIATIEQKVPMLVAATSLYRTG
jgi:hypothetical protein